MSNEKKDPGGVGLQIEAPSPVPSNSILTMPIGNINLPVPLSLEEKKYLLAVERGDLATVKRILQRAHRKHHINVNCVDSLGRGALTLAIDGENLEMVEMLVIMQVETKDALLLAINAEFVEAVELLLEHEELIHKEGEPYSWQKVDINTAMFTPDVTPLMLAAHKNNYEILKILLDRGATLPMPHDVKCGCDECIRRSSEDSLRHSLARVNEYRALASPSLIALSSQDPLLTAFQLSWELRNLAFAEQECKSEYLELRRQCQTFAVDLLDQSRSSQELAIILNYDPESPPYMDGDHMKLTRLELAIDYKQKKFVAHPNIQHLLGPETGPSVLDQPASRTAADLARSHGHRYRQVLLYLLFGTVCIRLWSEPTALVLCRPGKVKVLQLEGRTTGLGQPRGRLHEVETFRKPLRVVAVTVLGQLRHGRAGELRAAGHQVVHALLGSAHVRFVQRDQRDCAVEPPHRYDVQLVRHDRATLGHRVEVCPDASLDELL